MSYTPYRRLKDSIKFIRTMAEHGQLERTQSKHVAKTYGVTPEIIKRIKARYRNELSFGGDK